jgi:hypothetical protein
MKKILCLAVLLASLAATAATPPEISEKVLKVFKETFSTAENVSWSEFENKTCQANFNQSEIIVKAMFDNDGNLLETMRYYGEKNLPINVLAKVKKRYADKEIFGVTELISEAEVAYYITLKDEKNWIIIKSDPYANLQQTDKFKNAGVNK